MASTLTVDNIVGATTAANVKLPAGTVLQTVIASSTTQASTAVTDLATPVDYLSATITPKYSSSKILIRGNLSGGGSASGIGINVFIKAGIGLISYFFQIKPGGRKIFISRPLDNLGPRVDRPSATTFL